MQLFATGNVSLNDVEEALAKVLDEIKDVLVFRQNKQLVLAGKYHGLGLKGKIQDTKTGPALHLSVTPHLLTALLLGLVIAPAIIALAFVTGMRIVPGYGWLIDPSLIFPRFFTQSGLINFGLVYLFIVVLTSIFILVLMSFSQRRTFPDVIRYAVARLQLQKLEMIDITCTFHKSNQAELIVAISLCLAGILCAGIHVIGFIMNPLSAVPLLSGVSFISILLIVYGTFITVLTALPKYRITQEGLQIQNWLATKRETLEWKEFTLREETLRVAKESRHVYRIKAKKVLILQSTKTKSHRVKLETKALREGTLLIKLLECMVSAGIIKKS